ncbi:unknown [Acidiphilium sp. CAG:727]|jgi:hypothetical protein|nr:unknown [Acidiphilium sp. CAG:727]
MFWRKFKRVMIWVLLGALVIASTVAFVKISKIEKTKDVNALSYSIGSLNADDGKEIKDEHSFRTKHLNADKFNKIDIKDKADVTYQIFYYNADKKFIGKSEDLSADTTELEKTQTVETVTENVKYFRVVIKVTDTAKKVTIFNMNKYVNQVTVTLNK